MTPMVPIAMFGWIPLSLWLFSRLKPRHAVITVFALGWMFLPQYKYGIVGLPDYSKVTAIAYAILLGTWIFNRRVFSQFRPHTVDLPMLIWCLVPVATSLSNDLGLYDGLSASLNRTAMWGLPYYIGRLYFNDRESLAELAFGIFLAGLVYIPFCLYEVVMSPRLHKIIYGWHPHDFSQAKRGGGYRPVVFMQHGLMVAMWMVMAFLSGYQLLRSGWLAQRFPKLRKYWKPALAILLVTIVLNKSTGALALILIAYVVLGLMNSTRASLPLILLVTLPILYVIARGGGYWDGQDLIDAAGSVASDERAGSLYYRLQNENILTVKAKERVWLGWGLHQRSFVFDDAGNPISVPDGLWILAFGQYGVIGLTALGALLILPPLLFLNRYPPERWGPVSIGAIAAQPLLIVLFTIDSLFNAMFNPLILLLCGALSSLWLTREPGRARQVAAAAGGDAGAATPRPPGRTRLF